VGRLVFAHPAYLWGLLALSLPILVHLFNRRRPRPLAFGAIEFVLRSQQRRVRRLRLRQILLLALRCLLIAGVALALSRPSLEPRGAQAAVARGPQATALVIDASLSMRYRRGSQTLFVRARSDALAGWVRTSPPRSPSAPAIPRRSRHPPSTGCRSGASSRTRSRPTSAPT